MFDDCAGEDGRESKLFMHGGSMVHGGYLYAVVWENGVVICAG